MENNWEYDYSELYRGVNAQPKSSTEPPTAPMEPPRKKGSGKGKKIALRILSLVLVAAVAFGGGWLGVYVGIQIQASNTPQSAAPSPNAAQPLPQNGGTAVDFVSVSSQVAPSVVVVTTEQLQANGLWGQYVTSGAGSGVILSEDGYIITNNHVISNATNIKVTLCDDTEYPATLVGTDRQSDVAVLKIEATGLIPPDIGNSDELAVGQNVLAVGNPLGELGGTVTNGIISALGRDVEVEGTAMTLLQHNAAVSPGNSGGGLFNERGELIGIVNAKSTGDYAEGLGFAIPINDAMASYNSIRESGYVTGRAALGVTVVALTSPQTAQQAGVSIPGVYIQSVTDGGAAAKAGLEPGDRFVSVDDTAIESTTDLTNLLSRHSVGDEIMVQVARGRKIITAKVVLGEQEAPVAP